MKRLICAFLLLCFSVTCGSMAQPEQTLGIPLHSARGDRGIHVWQTQQALHDLNYLTSEADGAFGEETAMALLAFQLDRGLLPTGEADAQTQRLLFTAPPPGKGDTLRPDWYGGGSDRIPVGARFQIKDVRTGIIFNCERVMGISHLDAESLSPEDTAKMLKAYGDEWSWDRRPILLNYLGDIYAASMNGKPHGWEVVPGNDMTGHFCVHFFGSRGDGSQRVDPDHLACTVEASFARWE